MSVAEAGETGGNAIIRYARDCQHKHQPMPATMHVRMAERIVCRLHRAHFAAVIREGSDTGLTVATAGLLPLLVL